VPVRQRSAPLCETGIAWCGLLLLEGSPQVRNLPWPTSGLSYTADLVTFGKPKFGFLPRRGLRHIPLYVRLYFVDKIGRKMLQGVMEFSI
jgi:hypothetical protein